ncbi:hypothetical protein ACHAXR_009274 [Thalassiosira sp. AJA248-18]
MASFTLPLLLLVSVSTSHVFLPRRRTKQSSTSWLASDISSFQRQQNVNFDGAAFTIISSWLKQLRGGADTGYFQDTAEETTAEESSASVANITVLESTSNDDASDISAKKTDGAGEEIEPMNDNEMVYATVGVLSIPTTLGDNNILLSYKCDDDPDHQIIERWGVNEATPIDKILPAIGNYANELALAEIFGCLCHGIVINLPPEMFDSEVDIFSSAGIASQLLDDVLLYVAEGIIRRLKGTQQITIPFSITAEGARDVQVNEYAMENVKAYIKGYLERAIHHVWEKRVGETVGVDQATDESYILQQCKVVVEHSVSSAHDTATKLAKRLLEQNSADETSKHNIVPRPLFGVLCNQAFIEIINGRRSGNGQRNEILGEWKKLSEDSITTKIAGGKEVNDNEVLEVDAATEALDKTEVQKISTDLRHRVESVMGLAFRDAEERLLEMENKMDEAFLNSSGDESIEEYPMPEFGSDVDSILSAMSASFLALVKDYESDKEWLEDYESDKEWLEVQRIKALKQVAETGIHRLFHLHLQSLRDHFGHWYERMLESCLDDDFDLEGYSSQEGNKSWKLQSQKAARQAEEGFMKAAFGSIPQICQHPEGELCDDLVGMYSCVEALRGLLEDMYEVTSMRGLEEEEWDDIMRVSGEDNDDVNLQLPSKSRMGLRQLIKNVKAKIQKRGPAKWYERFALKVLVIGVNYIQGSIVLHALRREATKRDLDMPKFPLF